MFAILGGTGHIGSALAALLLQRDQPVTIITRDERKRESWERRGATVAVVDVHDVPALARVFARSTRAFLLNPPADPATDIAKEERETAGAIVEAVRASQLSRVVVESTYGAQAGEEIGDLGVLYELEQQLGRTDVPVSVIRGAYYMSNWDAWIELARNEGRLPSLYRTDFVLPMVAPRDIAEVAAELLLSSDVRPGPTYVEGPTRYTPGDVASALASALGRPVAVDTIAETRWESFMREAGFSPAAARSMANMTRITLRSPELPESPVRGRTSLQRYLATQCAR